MVIEPDTQKFVPFATRYDFDIMDVVRGEIGLDFADFFKVRFTS